MITLCMDTSQKFLSIVLLKDNEVLMQYNEVCLRKQSEFIFPILIDLCEKASIKARDINQVVIPAGPGSYTGIRIAMTIAKVLCTQANIELYTVSTLQLYAGVNKNCWVLLDARAKRVYLGRYNQGVAVISDSVLSIEEAQMKIGKDDVVLGDGSLIGREDSYLNPSESFLALKEQWVKVENPHLLTPEYLKSSTEYLVKQ